MVATIALPRLMRVGERAFEQLPLLLRELGLSKPLIVTDAYLNGTGRIAQAVEMLALSGINAGIFADTVPDPTVDSVMAGVRSLSNGEYDCVVGIGGGSPIDTAKAIAVIGRHGGVPRLQGSACAGHSGTAHHRRAYDRRFGVRGNPLHRYH